MKINLTPDPVTSPATADSQSAMVEPPAPDDSVMLSGPPVMLSVPAVPQPTGPVIEAPGLGRAADQTAPSVVVPLRVPEGNLLQNSIQNLRNRFLDLAGSSLYWRLFVGCGFATLIGAITLMVLGPSPEQVRRNADQATVSNMKFVDQSTAAQPGASDSELTNGSPVVSQLTVVAHEGTGGAEPAEFDDPFVEQNLVTANIQHAIHRPDSAEDQRSIVQQVSASRNISAGPAWLSGSIEIEADLSQPQRNHERSRPSHR